MNKCRYLKLIPTVSSYVKRHSKQNEHFGSINILRLGLIFCSKYYVMRTKNLKNNSSPECNFYIGLDVHKKSWSVTIRTVGLEVAHFTQKPNPSQLLGYLKKNFPEGKYFSAYEAGFSGTSLHFALNNLGIQNIVVNAADIPQTKCFGLIPWY
jgi:hypothetical protein